MEIPPRTGGSGTDFLGGVSLELGLRCWNLDEKMGVEGEPHRQREQQLKRLGVEDPGLSHRKSDKHTLTTQDRSS